MSITTKDIEDLLEYLFRTGFLLHEQPESLEVDFEDLKIDNSWFSYCFTCASQYWAVWPNFARSLKLSPKDNCITTWNENWTYNYPNFSSFLAKMPFQVVTFPGLHEEWIDQNFKSYRFSIHPSLGWACAFQGDGHDFLVSRRWLEYGPWHVYYTTNDTSIVFFHDPETDAKTALEQASAGYLAMDPHEGGGLLDKTYFASHEFSGILDEETNTLKIVILGRDVSIAEMTDICFYRMGGSSKEDFAHFERLGLEIPEHAGAEYEPFEHVAYIFIEEQRAREHLHELWLRDLQCWAIIEGQEVRLDTDYNPTPQKPAWVQDFAERFNKCLEESE